MPAIDLIPLGAVNAFVLETIVRATRDAFGLATRIAPPIADIECAYSESRNQYHVSKLLNLVLNQPPGVFKVMGVAEVDIYLPIFTFLFGQAQLGGRGALVSTHRLHNRFYGLPEDPQLYAERIAKEAIHELGHTFGLLHCLDPACVMRSSTYVEDVDQKSLEFCLTCRRQLTEVLSR